MGGDCEAGRAEGEADKDHGEWGEQREWRLHQAEGEHHHKEGGGVNDAAQVRPEQLTHGEVAHTNRCGENCVVDLAVLQLVEDVEGGVEDGAIHGGTREECGGNEGRIGNFDTAVWNGADDTAHAVANAEQEEERLKEASDDDQPLSAIDEDVALEDAKGAWGKTGNHFSILFRKR